MPSARKFKLTSSWTFHHTSPIDFEKNKMTLDRDIICEDSATMNVKPEANNNNTSELDETLISTIQDEDGFLRCPFCNQKFDKLKEVTHHYFFVHMGDEAYWKQHLQLKQEALAKELEQVKQEAAANGLNKQQNLKPKTEAPARDLSQQDIKPKTEAPAKDLNQPQGLQPKTESSSKDLYQQQDCQLKEALAKDFNQQQPLKLKQEASTKDVNQHSSEDHHDKNKNNVVPTKLDFEPLKDLVIDIDGQATSLLDLANNINNFEGDFLIQNSLTNDDKTCPQVENRTESYSPVSTATSASSDNLSICTKDHSRQGTPPTVSATVSTDNPNQSAKDGAQQKEIDSNTDAKTSTEDQSSDHTGPQRSVSRNKTLPMITEVESLATGQDASRQSSSNSDVLTEVRKGCIDSNQRSCTPNGGMPVITKVESLASDEDARSQSPLANSDILKNANIQTVHQSTESASSETRATANSPETRAPSGGKQTASSGGQSPVKVVPFALYQQAEKSHPANATLSKLINSVYRSNTKRSTIKLCPFAQDINYVYEPTPAEIAVLQLMKSRSQCTCPYCSVKLSSVGEAAEHVAFHTNSTPFVCKHCDQSSGVCGFKTCYFFVLRSHYVVMHNSKRASSPPKQPATTVTITQPDGKQLQSTPKIMSNIATLQNTDCLSASHSPKLPPTTVTTTPPSTHHQLQPTENVISNKATLQNTEENAQVRAIHPFPSPALHPPMLPPTTATITPLSSRQCQLQPTEKVMSNTGTLQTTEENGQFRAIRHCPPSASHSPKIPPTTATITHHERQRQLQPWSLLLPTQKVLSNLATLQNQQQSGGHLRSILSGPPAAGPFQHPSTFHPPPSQISRQSNQPTSVPIRTWHLPDPAPYMIPHQPAPMSCRTSSSRSSHQNSYWYSNHRAPPASTSRPKPISCAIQGLSHLQNSPITSSDPCVSVSYNTPTLYRSGSQLCNSRLPSVRTTAYQPVSSSMNLGSSHCPNSQVTSSNPSATCNMRSRSKSGPHLSSSRVKPALTTMHRPVSGPIIQGPNHPANLQVTSSNPSDCTTAHRPVSSMIQDQNRGPPNLMHTPIYTTACQPSRKTQPSDTLPSYSASDTRHLSNHGNQAATCDDSNIPDKNPLLTNLLASTDRRKQQNECSKRRCEIPAFQVVRTVPNMKEQSTKGAEYYNFKINQDIMDTNEKQQQTYCPNQQQAPMSSIHTNSPVIQHPNSIEHHSSDAAFRTLPGPPPLSDHRGRLQTSNSSVGTSVSPDVPTNNLACQQDPPRPRVLNSRVVTNTSSGIPEVPTNLLTLVDDDGHVSCIELVSAEEEQKFVVKDHHRKRKLDEGVELKDHYRNKQRRFSGDVCLVDDVEGEVTKVKLVTSKYDPADSSAEVVQNSAACMEQLPVIAEVVSLNPDYQNCNEY